MQILKKYYYAPQTIEDHEKRSWGAAKIFFYLVLLVFAMCLAYSKGAFSQLRASNDTLTLNPAQYDQIIIDTNSYTSWDSTGRLVDLGCFSTNRSVPVSDIMGITSQSVEL